MPRTRSHRWSEAGHIFPDSIQLSKHIPKLVQASSSSSSSSRDAAGRWELLHRGKRMAEVSNLQLLSSSLQASGSSKHLARLSIAPGWNQDTRLVSDDKPDSGAGGENGGARFKLQINKGSGAQTPAFVRLKPIDPVQDAGWTANNPGQVVGVRQDLGRRDSTPRRVAKHFSRCVDVMFFSGFFKPLKQAPGPAWQA